MRAILDAVVLPWPDLPAPINYTLALPPCWKPLQLVNNVLYYTYIPMPAIKSAPVEYCWLQAKSAIPFGMTCIGWLLAPDAEVYFLYMEVQ